MTVLLMVLISKAERYCHLQAARSLYTRSAPVSQCCHYLLALSLDASSINISFSFLGPGASTPVLIMSAMTISYYILSVAFVQKADVVMSFPWGQSTLAVICHYRFDTPGFPILPMLVASLCLVYSDRMRALEGL